MFHQIEERERFSFAGSSCSTDPYPDAWFSTEWLDIVHAKQVCRGCPIQAECLEHSVRNNEQFGVWGGFTHEERGFHHTTRF